jgi:hypothetical protein
MIGPVRCGECRTSVSPPKSKVSGVLPCLVMTAPRPVLAGWGTRIRSPKDSLWPRSLPTRPTRVRCRLALLALCRRFGLRNVEHRCCVRPAVAGLLFLASGLVDFGTAGAVNESHDLDAVLAALDRTPQGFPSVKREYVLAWTDVGRLVAPGIPGQSSAGYDQTKPW